MQFLYDLCTTTVAKTGPTSTPTTCVPLPLSLEVSVDVKFLAVNPNIYGMCTTTKTCATTSTTVARTTTSTSNAFRPECTLRRYNPKTTSVDRMHVLYEMLVFAPCPREVFARSSLPYH